MYKQVGGGSVLGGKTLKSEINACRLAKSRIGRHYEAPTPRSIM